MQEQRARMIKMAGWISILFNLLLFGFKLWVGIQSGSVALKADAWHTLSDSITSMVVIIGIWISAKPADRNHPFGHGRAELLSAIVIGLLLAVIGFEFLNQSIQRLINRDVPNYGSAAIIVTIASVLIKEGLAQYTRIIGTRADSKALKADSWHHRSDAITSVVILTGIFLSPYAWWLDGVLGIAVTLFIFHTTYEILRDAFHPLLGENPEPELVEKINRISRLHLEQEVFPHHIHIHRYGYHTEMTLHIKLPGDLSLETAHDRASLMEKAIRNELNIEATIHMEPLTT